MRLEFNMELNKIEVPRFSVEAVEGIGKVFTLVTLVLNVFETHERVEIVFHGLNSEDPVRKIEGLKEIIESSPTARSFRYEVGECVRVQGSSSYYQWLTIISSPG
jgi:hypothetical protein